MNDVFRALIAAHSTPGEEHEVKEILLQCWRNSGWQVSALGRYAVIARQPPASGAQPPRLLICAHMDSPGFIVDRPGWSSGADSAMAQVHIVPLGSPSFDTDAVAARLKCRNGLFDGTIRQSAAEEDDDDPEFCFQMAGAEAQRADLCIGDRLCFAAVTDCGGELITAPFLDNRLGCWMLTQLAAREPGWNSRYEIILAATGCEEINGSGAQVLAAQVEADLVIVLDATYATEAQGVRLGNGAVITLSDASILLSLATRDHIRQIMEQAGVPIQFEAYNYSGTDVRAFPMQGRTTPVLALLIPTRGNHSPCETAHRDDLKHWESAIRVLEAAF